MHKEIRLRNKLTTEDITNDEFVIRMQKRFLKSGKSSLSETEQRELRKEIMSNEINAELNNIYVQ
ncbi:hypothetical protein [Marinilactibacillus sp. Marseille-P9653]|uniref:hypothetical protein n=1 Tax=Marinilactibacillus sp. Marseille-P9653 TaxID=2866583 RepID=UPI001CE3E223|nr:hypothetical protein [Marinilactibacillus sp. Marseille-P9653]